jgi:hypothetical protein
MNDKYLMIRNNGLAPIEAFTILGLSTARGEDDKIGQFGSGSKHGILTLMRNNVGFKIFIGEDELVFSTHPASMAGKEYLEVRYTFQGEQHKTGMCLDFGALDWDTVTMSLREFICNALDQGEGIHDCVFMAETTTPHPEETRIYISAESEAVSDYWANIRNNFLHFDGLETQEIITSNSKTTKFYRRGVYVTESKSETPPLFTYNFQNGRIDESRNLDGAAVSSIAARLLIKSSDRIADIFSSFGQSKRWEHNIGDSLYYASNRDDAQNCLSAWTRVFGDKPFAVGGEESDRLTKKKIAHAVVPLSYSSYLRYCGVKTAKELLSKLDEWNAEECEPTESAMDTFKRVWKWLEAVRLTEGKAFPAVKCFSMPMQNGEEKMGFYKNGTVYLNLDYDTNEQTALEELAHYITGAEDETRDFQDFAFKVATRMAKVRLT